jgi:hypothetical protein
VGGGLEIQRDSANLSPFREKKIDQEIQKEMPVTLSGSRNRSTLNFKISAGEQKHL